MVPILIVGVLIVVGAIVLVIIGFKESDEK